MNLLKTSALNAIAVAVKMLTLLGLNKVLAVYVGPSGYAVIGQLQNAIQMITTFSSGAINAGVVRYTAEFKGDEKAQHTVWRTAGRISLVGSLIASVAIALASKPLAKFVVGDKELYSIFLWFSVSIVFFVFNALLLSVVNGKKEVVTYVLANIAGSLLSLLIVSVMTAAMGFGGALIALAVYQSFSFVVTLAFCARLEWFKLRYFFGGFDAAIARKLAQYTLMAVVSALCMPVSQMFVRTNIGETLGWTSAGYWEAMWRVSAAYLMLVTTTLSVYYLPRLSEINDRQEIYEEVLSGYKLILPVVILCSFVMYGAREFVVSLLFSDNFRPVSELFAFQLTGDVLKIASWILGYILTAKAYVKLFVLSELVFSVTFVFLAKLLVQVYGLQGAAMAYAVTYVIHLAGMVCVVKVKKIM